jgi:molybdopterin-synthase adenylyltransferase
MGNRFSRQSFLGQSSQILIESSKVAIIGLCGGGSHVAQQLAHVGFRRIVLIDYDNADDTNLNRMVGLTWADAKAEARKIDVIERLIKDINPNADVEKFARPWQECGAVLKECDVIFGCVDTYTAREQLERFARRFLIPYIDIGMDVHGGQNAFSVTGQVILSLPDCPCMRCMGFINEEQLAKEAEGYGKAGGRPQVVWPNGTLASIAVGKWMSILTPWSGELHADLYTEYDGNRMLVGPSPRANAVRNAICRHYGQPGSIGDHVF